MPAKTAERGYGGDHQRLRRQTVREVEMGATCASTQTIRGRVCSTGRRVWIVFRGGGHGRGSTGVVGAGDTLPHRVSPASKY